MSAVQSAGEPMKTSGGKVVKTCERASRRSVPPDQVRQTLLDTPLPAVHVPVAGNQVSDTEAEEEDGISVSEHSHSTRRQNNFEVMIKWAEDTVREVLFPRTTALKIAPSGKANRAASRTVERHLSTLENGQAKIKELTGDRSQQLRDMKAEYEAMEEPVAELLDRMGGTCEYRIVVDGQEKFATMFLTKPRQPKAPGPKIKELRNIVYTSSADAFEAHCPTLNVQTADFDELSDAWRGGAMLVAGDNLKRQLEATQQRSEQPKRRRVQMRRMKA